MTKNDLVNKIGIIARFGTKIFMKAWLQDVLCPCLLPVISKRMAISVSVVFTNGHMQFQSQHCRCPGQMPFQIPCRCYLVPTFQCPFD